MLRICEMALNDSEGTILKPTHFGQYFMVIFPCFRVCVCFLLNWKLFREKRAKDAKKANNIAWDNMCVWMWMLSVNCS